MGTNGLWSVNTVVSSLPCRYWLKRLQEKQSPSIPYLFEHTGVHQCSTTVMQMQPALLLGAKLLPNRLWGVTLDSCFTGHIIMLQQGYRADHAFDCLESFLLWAVPSKRDILLSYQKTLDCSLIIRSRHACNCFDFYGIRLWSFWRDNCTMQVTWSNFNLNLFLLNFRLTLRARFSKFTKLQSSSAKASSIDSPLP